MAVKPLPGAQLDRSHPLAQGLAGCWLMNEGSGLSVYDYSGNDVHATLTNMPDTSWQASEDGSAVMFGGSDDKLSCGTFDPSAGEITLVAHAYITDANQCLIAKRDTWTAGGMRWQWMYSRIIPIGWQFKVSGTGNTRVIPWTLAVGWHTFTMINDPAGSYSMYVDGALVGETTGLAYDTKTTAELKIGASGDAAEYWRDRISHAGIYNRVLTADEVAWRAAEPYCMFARPDRWLRVFDFGAAAAGAVYRPWLMTGGRMR